MRGSFEKYALVRRVIHEFEYGLRLSSAVVRLRPSVVASSNTPLIAAALFQVVMRLRRIPVVFGQQDVYSVGITEHLTSRFGRPGRAFGRALMRVEAWVARSSATVVTITRRLRADPAFVGRCAGASSRDRELGTPRRVAHPTPQQRRRS